MQIYLAEGFILFSEHLHENILKTKLDCCYSAAVDSPSQGMSSPMRRKILKIDTGAFR